MKILIKNPGCLSERMENLFYVNGEVSGGGIVLNLTLFHVVIGYA